MYIELVRLCRPCLMSDGKSMQAAIDFNSSGSSSERVLDRILAPLLLDDSAGRTTPYQPQAYRVVTDVDAARLYLRAWRCAQGFLMSHGQFVGFSWKEDLLSCLASVCGSLLYKSLVALALSTFIRCSSLPPVYVIVIVGSSFQPCRQRLLACNIGCCSCLMAAFDFMRGLCMHTAEGGDADLSAMHMGSGCKPGVASTLAWWFQA